MDVEPDQVSPEGDQFTEQSRGFSAQTIGNFAWPVFVIGVIGWVLYHKYQDQIQNWLSKRNQQKQDAFHHKNPDILIAREAAIEAARLKLQEKYSQASAEAREQEKKKEEERRKRKAEEAEALLRGIGGRRLQEEQEAKKDDSKDKSKFSTKRDFNPLMGGGGSCSWRPTNRRAGG